LSGTAALACRQENSKEAVDILRTNQPYFDSDLRDDIDEVFVRVKKVLLNQSALLQAEAHF